MILRAILLACGTAALVGTLTIDRPESFAVTLPCALVTMVVGAGAAAADAVPLRPTALACSIATIVLGAALLARDQFQAAIAAGIVALQLIALVAGRRGRGAAARSGVRELRRDPR